MWKANKGTIKMLPIEIHFEIEKECLLHCLHCSSAYETSYIARGYDNFDILELLRLFKNRTQYIFFTGGEPLLYEKLYELLANINGMQLDIHIGLFTTGIMQQGNKLVAISDKVAKKLKDNNVQSCYLSLYSNKPQVHDYITTAKSSFSLTEQSIKNLQKNSIDVKLNSVINALNEDEWSELLVYACENDISEIRFLELVKHGRAIKNWSVLCLKSHSHKEIVKKIIGLNEVKTKISVSSYPELIPCRPIKQATGCGAGTQLLYVTYSGDVYPCACVKNKQEYRISHITELEKLENYIKKMKMMPRLNCLNDLGELS